MGIRTNTKEIQAALDVVRESQAIRLQLMVSINSGSLALRTIDSGLGSYLKATKVTFRVQLAVGYLKMVCGLPLKATLAVVRAGWSLMIAGFNSFS